MTRSPSSKASTILLYHTAYKMVRWIQPFWYCCRHRRKLPRNKLFRWFSYNGKSRLSLHRCKWSSQLSRLRIPLKTHLPGEWLGLLWSSKDPSLSRSSNLRGASPSFSRQTPTSSFSWEKILACWSSKRSQKNSQSRLKMRALIKRQIWAISAWGRLKGWRLKWTRHKFHHSNLHSCLRWHRPSLLNLITKAIKYFKAQSPRVRIGPTSMPSP